MPIHVGDAEAGASRGRKRSASEEGSTGRLAARRVREIAQGEQGRLQKTISRACSPEKDFRVASVILALHDSDHSWLPAFMRQHGMSGMGEELAAFVRDLCDHFLSLPPEE